MAPKTSPKGSGKGGSAGAKQLESRECQRDSPPGATRYPRFLFGSVRGPSSRTFFCFLPPPQLHAVTRQRQQRLAASTRSCHTVVALVVPRSVFFGCVVSASQAAVLRDSRAHGKQRLRMIVDAPSSNTLFSQSATYDLGSIGVAWIGGRRGMSRRGNRSRGFLRTVETSSTVSSCRRSSGVLCTSRRRDFAF